MAHLLQRLYDACKDTFATPGLAPSPEGLQHVKSLVDAMTLEDLGLDEEILAHASEASESPQSVFYLHIYHCACFSMGIFYLPTSVVIPLHDHPGMTVLGKLLHGSMHLKSYDWAEPFVQLPDTEFLQARLAKTVVDQTFIAPCESFILHPTGGGNIHAFTAVTHCAVLDVLAPPYSPTEGRPCTYYDDCLHSNTDTLADEPSNIDISDGSVAWLEVIDSPADLVKCVPYKPPAIIL